MYYNKKDIENYIREEIKSLEDKQEARLLTPISQPLTQLKNEEEVVGFCYTTLTENNDGKKMPQMTAKVFVRIDHDLYTDDRFALDQYQASKDGKVVSEVIHERHREQEQALKELTGESLESISKLYEQNKTMDS